MIGGGLDIGLDNQSWHILTLSLDWDRFVCSSRPFRIRKSELRLDSKFNCSSDKAYPCNRPENPNTLLDYLLLSFAYILAVLVCFAWVMYGILGGYGE